ncbi:hypothetical protein ACFVW1_31525 [Streptomyces olivochromogenes]|uniref:hypothetical protein n=1 Tax=Streptomyces olivochromogenes TaxID=1963 RepID=UPI0036DA223C
MALVAAVGFVLIGPAADALAASPPPSPTADSGAGEPTRWNKFQWQMYQSWVNEALDPHDPQYKARLIAQAAVKRFFKRMESGGTGFSPKSDVPAFVQDYIETSRQWQQTVPGLTKQVTQAGDRIAKLKKKAAQAKTPAQRDRAEKKLAQARRQYQDVANKLRNAKATQPQDVKTQLKELDQRVGKLENKVRALEQKKKRLLPAGRELVQKQIDDLHKELSQAKAKRARLQGPPEGGDETGGTRTTTPDPKNPPTGGVVKTSPKDATTGSVVKTSPKNATTGSVVKTSPKNARVTGPKTPGLTPSGLRVGVPRGGRGTGGVVTQIYADLASQAWMEYVSERDQKLHQQALEDPALRQRIINEYNDVMDNNGFEEFVRPFTGPEFTAGSLREVGPKLVEHQNMLDTTKTLADKSNSDPLYQQARIECGGYDTCVTDRVKKLRDQNAQAVDDSTKAAQESNSDPLYQQARIECGGYDTCVTDRVKKLRAAEQDRQAKNRDAQIADIKQSHATDTQKKHESKAEQDRQAKNRDAQIADIKQSSTPKKKADSGKPNDKVSAADAALKKARDNKVATMKA